MHHCHVADRPDATDYLRKLLQICQCVMYIILLTDSFIVKCCLWRYTKPVWCGLNSLNSVLVKLVWTLSFDLRLCARKPHWDHLRRWTPLPWWRKSVCDCGDFCLMLRKSKWHLKKSCCASVATTFLITNNKPIPHTAVRDALSVWEAFNCPLGWQLPNSVSTCDFMSATLDLFVISQLKHEWVQAKNQQCIILLWLMKKMVGYHIIESFFSFSTNVE